MMNNKAGKQLGIFHLLAAAKEKIQGNILFTFFHNASFRIPAKPTLYFGFYGGLLSLKGQVRTLKRVSDCEAALINSKRDKQ